MQNKGTCGYRYFPGNVLVHFNEKYSLKARNLAISMEKFSIKNTGILSKSFLVLKFQNPCEP